MNKIAINKTLLALFLLTLSGCSLFSNKADNSDGTGNILTEYPQITFNAAIGSSSSKTVQFTNTTSGTFTVTRFYLQESDCSHFTIASYTNPSGSTKNYSDITGIKETVRSDETISILVTYTPRDDCDYEDNFGTLEIYYDTASTKNNVATVILEPTVASGGSEDDEVECTDDPRSHDYSISYTYEPGSYYLEITRMRGWILPKAVPDQNTFLGTDIDVDPNLFQHAYLLLTVNTDGTFTLAIDTCDDFFIPSASDQPYMQGANTYVTGEAKGTLSDDGNLSTTSATIKLHADGILDDDGDPAGLVANNDGVFQVKTDISLTTESTDGDIELQRFVDSYDGNDLAIDGPDSSGDYYMTGQPIKYGRVILVGTGTFIEEDALVSATAESIMFGDSAKPTKLYVVIEATLKTRVEE